MPKHRDAKNRWRYGRQHSIAPDHTMFSARKNPCVYILASRRNGTLYVGVTSDLSGRMSDHAQGLKEGFTKRYLVKLLVYYEMQATMSAAILREKQLKTWNRLWKLRIIEETNPEWLDLFDRETGAIDEPPALASRLASEPTTTTDLSGFPPTRE